MLAAVVDEIQFIAETAPQPRLAGHLRQRMVPDAQAQPALGAKLLETGEQHVAHRRHDQKQRYQHSQRRGDQQIAAGEDVQVQRAADRQHQGDDRPTALGEQQHHQHDDHRQIEPVAGFFFQ